jgi:TetR/AcrR family transcriptional regulator, lmrAB and yxaGH operons repressor
MSAMATQTRERMIEATARLLHQRGYYGTSLNDILEASGAPRGSLYFHFPGGKDQLVLEATRRAVEQTTHEVAAILDSAESPARGVRAVVELTGQIMDESDYTFGCPVAPLILDSPADHPELAELCRRAFEEWVGMMQTTFVKAGIDEDRANSLALLVESSIEGLLLMARAYRNSKPMNAVATELERIVAEATPSSDTRAKAAAQPSAAQ